MEPVLCKMGFHQEPRPVRSHTEAPAWPLAGSPHVGIATTAARSQPGLFPWPLPVEEDLEGTRQEDGGREGALTSQLLATSVAVAGEKLGNRPIAGMLG